MVFDRVGAPCISLVSPMGCIPHMELAPCVEHLDLGGSQHVGFPKSSQPLGRNPQTDRQTEAAIAEERVTGRERESRGGGEREKRDSQPTAFIDLCYRHPVPFFGGIFCIRLFLSLLTCSCPCRVYVRREPLSLCVAYRLIDQGSKTKPP